MPELSGGIPPGHGPVSVNDPVRLVRLGELDDAVAADRPWVRRVPYARYLMGEGGTVPSSIRPDGLHVDPDAVPAMMVAGFEAELAAAYRAVAGVGASLTTWSSA